MHYYFVGPTATGNSTALSAMQSLGFTTQLYPTGISQCRTVDAVADLSVAYWFRSEQLPLDDAQIVLTTRGDIDGWLAECEKRYAMASPDLLGPLAIEARRAIFGQVEFSPEVWRAAYSRHVAQCGELAAKAGKVLHIWDVVAEPTWDFLCALTGRRAPDRPFPFYRSKWPSAPRMPAELLEENGPLRRAPIQVRPSPLGGRGVFAAKPIREGALLEECPVLITDTDYDELGDYVFNWGEGEDNRLALPLGYGACYNHANDPNANWQMDERRGLMIVWAIRDIAADEEILISYGPRWFPTRGLYPAQELRGKSEPALSAS